jgi:hypothetical protein
VRVSIAVAFFTVILFYIESAPAKAAFELKGCMRIFHLEFDVFCVLTSIVRANVVVASRMVAEGSE